MLAMAGRAGGASYGARHLWPSVEQAFDDCRLATSRWRGDQHEQRIGSWHGSGLVFKSCVGDFYVLAFWLCDIAFHGRSINALDAAAENPDASGHCKTSRMDRHAGERASVLERGCPLPLLQKLRRARNYR